MAKKIAKTNAVRLIEQQKISYEILDKKQKLDNLSTVSLFLIK